MVTLEARATEPGLWVNPAYQPGTQGTFAVIIGVSRYQHLNGGEAPAQETYGLGQLSVSALTAFRIFGWLTEKYHFDGCPLVMAWVLLAPTQEEVIVEPGLGVHLIAPTFDNCRKAIKFWYQHMKDLPQAAAETSRAFFFWSGHGLEVHQEKQILLPCDYLAPPAPALNDAVSTQNLKLGTASLAVEKKFFFIDACRNDHYGLRAKKVQGAEILNEDEAAVVNSQGIAPLLYATASGQQAFQQPAPNRGLSIFGQALLDGLSGQPDIQLDCRNNVCTVKLYPLQGYVEERVVKLLDDAQAKVTQPVRLGGISRNEPVTHIDRATRPVVSVPGGPPWQGGGTTPAARASRIEATITKSYAVSHLVDPGIGSGAWAGDFSIAHDLFGSEQVTEPWRRLRVYSFESRQWGGPDLLLIHQIERREDRRMYRVELSIAGHYTHTRAHWLQLTDTAGVTHGLVLPGDAYLRPRFVLDFDVEFVTSGGRPMTRLESALSMDNPSLPSLIGVAADMWQRYRTADVGEAVSAYDQNLLEDAVRKKFDSPLAATVAAIILLRANRLDLLHDWLRNLADKFPHLPDGAALWAEQLLRQSEDRPMEAIESAAKYLSFLTERGLPHTGEALGYSAVLVDRLKRQGDRVPATTRRRLSRLSLQLDRALTFFRPGGLFSVYTGFDDGQDPLDLVGPWPM